MLLAAFLSLTSCYSPQKVNYSYHLESGYKDPTPKVLKEKSERLEEMDFKNYLIETEEYLGRLNAEEEELDMEEFYARLLPFHEYLEVAANETFPIERINISDNPRILGSPITIGTARTGERIIFLKEKHLRLETYAHEFGHMTDNKENFTCGLRLTGIGVCPDSYAHRMRIEMVADAFVLSLAYSLVGSNRRIASEFSMGSVPYLKPSDPSISVADLLSTLSEDEPRSFYVAEGKVIAVLQRYKFGNAKATWEYVRSHNTRHIIRTLDGIVRRHGSLGRLIDSGLDEIEDHFR